MRNKIIAIIQARMGSSRFPGKMKAELGGFPIIDWVIRRSLKSKLVHNFILATSINSDNEYLIVKANKYGIDSFRGSEDNVLSRFIKTTKNEKANIIVRICADNPLICGSEIDRIIKVFLDNNPDYAFNHIPSMGNNYVDGIGAEVISLHALDKIAEKANDPTHFEHVTKYIWDNPSKFSIQTIYAPTGLDYPNVSLDVDSHEDLAFLAKAVSSIDSFTSPEDVDLRQLLSSIVEKN